MQAGGIRVMATDRLSDPKGYYRTLGIEPGADNASIKAAFRQLAMEIHPDRNSSPDAHEKFHAITSAYEVLSDPEQRARYDALPRNDRPDHGRRAHYSQYTSAAGSNAESQSRPQKETSHKKHEKEPHTQTRRTRTWSASSPLPVLPSSCDRCGLVAAQPRYVVFPLVQGNLLHSLRSSIEGLYCRRCADITGLQVSARNWILGWWSPLGPVDTIRALWTTARGGVFPADRNYRALMHQARAFLARQEPDVARSIARQARQFATTAGQKHAADTLVPTHAGTTARQLKDRWTGVGSLRLLQLSPLYLAGAAATVFIWNTIRDTWPSSQIPEGDHEAESSIQTIPSLRAGGLHETMAGGLAIRSGPGSGFQKTGELAAGAMVLVTEIDTGGDWARIITPSGASGYVPSRFLKPVQIPREQRRTDPQTGQE